MKLYHGSTVKEYQNYDIIEGGIANDKVFNTVELFFTGLIDKSTALQRLKYEAKGALA